MSLEKVWTKDGIIEVEMELPNPRISEIELELQEILQWFSENDWKANKRVREEWTASDTRWLDYVLECEIMRNRQDELKNELATIV